MKKIYFYPSVPIGGYGNPYPKNFKTAISKYYKVVDKVGMQAGASFCLLRHSFLADIYILNWIESISSHRFSVVQYLVACLSLRIIKLRGKEIVWMLHNVHPHKGVDKYSESIMSYLYEHANLIVAHSKEAAEYAKGKAKGRVEYICHPVAPIAIPNEWDGSVEPYDVLIWGEILPYKGILEFVSNAQVRESGFKIFIVGKCKDAKLSEQLNAYCNDFIHYENRRASYSELKALMNKARYVLFPYLSGSVSSSGALIDTIVLGGTPVGSNIGAFKDLAREGGCLVYDDYARLLDILSSDRTVDDVKREDFIAQNTWDLFAKKLDKLLIGSK